MRRVAETAALLGALAAASAVLAQDSPASTNVQSENAQEQQAGQIASVGAGTSSAVTTGVSGPEAADAGGEISVPPVPRDDLCEDYAGQPAYEPCLATVTSERSVQ